MKGLFSVVAVVFLLAVVLVIRGERGNKEENVSEPSESADVNIVDSTREEPGMDELKIEDIIVGKGAEAVAGKRVTVNYLGTLTNGTKFDSSYDRATPFTFSLGAGQVIEGWDLGVVGMKVGGKRRLTIPPSLGYGEAGAGGVIPPNATLIFEVELVATE